MSGSLALSTVRRAIRPRQARETISLDARQIGRSDPESLTGRGDILFLRCALIGGIDECRDTVVLMREVRTSRLMLMRS